MSPMTGKRKITCIPVECIDEEIRNKFLHTSSIFYHHIYSAKLLIVTMNSCLGKSLCFAVCLRA